YRSGIAATLAAEIFQIPTPSSRGTRWSRMWTGIPGVSMRPTCSISGGRPSSRYPAGLSLHRGSPSVSPTESNRSSVFMENPPRGERAAPGTHASAPGSWVAALALPWGQHVLVGRPAEHGELTLGFWRQAPREPEAPRRALEIRPPGKPRHPFRPRHVI